MIKSSPNKILPSLPLQSVSCPWPIVDNLNVEELNVDFYTGNLHKWAYACKGTAFLWVNPLHQGYIHPLNTSHNYKMPFPDEFFRSGTNDSETKYVAAAAAMDFYDR